MEISFRVADPAKTVFGNIQSQKDVWAALEKRFGARQEGISKLQLAA